MIPEADGACALHAGVAATFTCPRCGAFGCRECERRTRPDAFPICPECWDRRAKVEAVNVQKSDMTLPNIAVGLAVLGLVPFVWPGWVGAVIVGAVALSRLPSPHPGRTRAIVAMCMAPIGMLVTAVALGVMVGSH